MTISIVWSRGGGGEKSGGAHKFSLLPLQNTISPNWSEKWEKHLDKTTPTSLTFLTSFFSFFFFFDFSFVKPDFFFFSFFFFLSLVLSGGGFFFFSFFFLLNFYFYYFFKKTFLDDFLCYL